MTFLPCRLHLYLSAGNAMVASPSVEAWKMVAMKPAKLWARVLTLLATAWLSSTIPALQAQDVSAPDAAPEADRPPPDPLTIPPSAFASRSNLAGAKLSPDGSKFAFRTIVEDKSLLAIVDAETLQPLRSISLESADEVNWYNWAGPGRILFSVGGFAITNRWFGYYSRLMLYDIETRAVRYIGFDKQGPEGDDVLYLDPAGQFVILSASRDILNPPDVWRFPLDGSGEKAAVKVQQRQDGIEEWWADDSGVVRLGMNFTSGGSTIIHYRSRPDQPLRRISKIKKKDSGALENWGIMGIIAGSDMGYAMIESDNGKQVLHKVDYDTGARVELVYENPDWSLDSVISAPGRGPIGVEYIDDAPQVHWLDPEMASHQRNLEQALGGGRVKIFSMSDDRSRMLVQHSSAADPGALYVYTPGQKRLDLYANLRPDIDFRSMSQPQPFSFTSRDGHTMHGYLTLPKGQAGRALPLIVYPHGGPYGVRDMLVYDDWVQLFASRGYAVLQVNFRGSGGYGTAFEELGDGEMGRRMQDDLDDALDWAVGQGYADPARVCIVGASYGGYAALWGVLRNPDRYRCAASVAGVTDLDDILKYDRNYLGRSYYRRVWKSRVTGEKGTDLGSISPVDQIARLQRPVLLVHGSKDRRVPIAQFEKLVAAAGKAGKTLETLKVDDGHSFVKEENKRQLYETLLAFLEKHNPADPAPVAEADLSATGG